MRAFYFVAIIVAFAMACSGNQEEVSADSVSACKRKSVNPNGDSELAILMREMANWTDSCKAALEDGTPLPAKPTTLSTLHTAKKTDETIDIGIFNSMATVYENAVSTFESADASRKIEAYNGMVSACKSCHSSFCQGPLVRINKMPIAQ